MYSTSRKSQVNARVNDAHCGAAAATTDNDRDDDDDDDDRMKTTDNDRVYYAVDLTQTG